MSEPPPPAASRGAGFRIARNATSLLVGDGAGEILNGYAIALAAVSLGPAGFGTLSEAQAFMEPFDALASFGLGSVAITVSAQRGGCDGALRGTVYRIRLVAALVASTVAIAVAFASGRGHLFHLLALFGIGMLVTPTTMISNLPFQYEQTIHRRIAVPFLVAVVRLGTAYAAFWLLNQPVGFQLSGLAAGVAAALIGRALARRDYPDRLRFDPALARELLRLAWPVAVLEFVVTCYTRASYLFLHGAGAQVIGEYAAADRLLRPFLALGGAVFLSSFPTLAQLAAQRQFAILTRAYRRAIGRLLLGLCPVALAAWYLAPWLLTRFASEYQGAIWPFRILMLGSFFLFLNQLSATFIMALGKFRLIMLVALANLAVYLVLASQLVPRFGARGAALATTTMEGINTVIQVVIVYCLLKSLVRATPEATS